MTQDKVIIDCRREERQKKSFVKSLVKSLVKMAGIGNGVVWSDEWDKLGIPTTVFSPYTPKYGKQLSFFFAGNVVR